MELLQAIMLRRVLEIRFNFSSLFFVFRNLMKCDKMCKTLRHKGHQSKKFLLHIEYSFCMERRLKF
jgi:hypothetical protein